MDPLKQFEILTIFRLPTLFGQNIDFTNSSLYMLLAVFFSCIFLYSGVYRARIVPGGMQCIAEALNDFVTSLIKSSCGEAGLRYTGLVIAVFVFVLSCNIAGMLPLPLSFTVTSHIAVTLGVSAFIFLFVTFVGIRTLGKGFFALFLPEGTPLWLAPLMIPLELCTYMFRPISLAVRLTANMIAGHTILKVIAGFVTPLSFAVSPLSFIFVMLLIVFEVFVAVLQAYIFAVLICVYLSDSLKGH